jgi:hypothetical protein
MNPEVEFKVASDKKSDLEMQSLLQQIEELQKKVQVWKDKKKGDIKLEAAERMLNLCKERATGLDKSPLSVQKGVYVSQD